ncbi:MAG: hypothetical protein KDD67_11375 [Ignavibacteriae bacterium]|nr:hypothetical protein [Ignavibacteriota bacterium]MCB9215888.1 hypothetical protein [Ignavibacteria bacterium]
MKQNKRSREHSTPYLESLRSVELRELWAIDEKILQLRQRKQRIMQRILSFEFDPSLLELMHRQLGSVDLVDLMGGKKEVLMFVPGYVENDVTLSHIAQLDALMPHLNIPLSVIVLAPDQEQLQVPELSLYENITVVAEPDCSFCYNLGLMELHRNGEGITADYIPGLLLFTLTSKSRLTLVNFDFVLPDKPLALLLALAEVIGRA